MRWSKLSTNKTKQTNKMKNKFTLLFAATIVLLLNLFTTPNPAVGQTRGTITFDFEDESAHRTSGNNSYSSSPNTYSENGVDITLTYADAVTSGTPLAGSANVIGRIARNTTNSPVVLLGPISISDKTITKIEYNTKGVAKMSQVLETSLDNSTWTSQLSITSMPTSNTKKETGTLSITGTNLYVRITTSVSSSTGSARDLQIDDIIISYTTSGGGSTTYTVTYDGNGKTSGDVPLDDHEYNSGDEVTVLDNTGDLAKEHYTWHCWNTQANGNGDNYVADDKFEISANTTLYAIWVPNTHAVTLPEATTEGSFSLSYTFNNSTITSPSAVPYGVEVTLIFTPNSGYDDYEATWSVDGTPIANNGYKFTMPDADVTVTATVAKATSWTYTHAANDGSSPGTGQWIYIDNKFKVKQTKVGNNDIASNQSEIRLYKSHYLEITPSTGFDKVITSVELTCSATDYNFTGATHVAGANSSDTEAVTATANNLVYTIDLSSITNCAYLKITAAGQQVRITQIKVNYASKYTITYANNLTNGAFAGSGNPTTSIAGKNITITTVPSEGYHLATLTYNDINATVNGVTGTFTMPEANVTVNATFEQDPTYTITYNENGETSTDDVTRGIIGDKLLDSPVGDVPANMTFVGWSTGTIGTYQTTLPTLVDENYNVTGNVTFYAVYKYDYSYTTGGSGTPTWTKVTDANTLHVGDQLVIAYYDDLSDIEKIAGETISSGYMAAVDASDLFDDNVISSLPNGSAILTLGGSNNSWTLAKSSNSYLSGSNTTLSWSGTASTWSIGISAGLVTIANSGIVIKYNTGSPRFKPYGPASSGVELPQLYRLEGGSTTVEGTYYLTSVTVKTDDETISTLTNWDGNNIIDAEIIVANTGKLTVGGLLISPDADFLTINDGGQLVCGNDGVQATFKKAIAQTTITGDVTDNKHWYAISSPVNTPTITSVTNLVNAGEGFKYNLFRYNEAESTWEAYNTTNHPEFIALENGRGYLYRNNLENDVIAFAGTVNVSPVSVDLTASGEGIVKGFNLIGNPFGEDISMTNITGKSFSGGYILSNAGAWNPTIQTTIRPCQGFLVQVAAGEKISINKPAVAKNTTYNQEYLQFVVANDDYEDVAYALFDKGYGLKKINHRNADVPMLYIPQNGQDYAIAMMNDNIKVCGLNFKAATMGQYTLSYKANGEYNYLHVIDRLTGSDVDMLLEGEYKFIATPNDKDNRFIVKLEYMPDYSESDDEIFAYQTGSEVLVSGSGELQIFDVTGRQVMTTTINGAEAISVPAQGVYIFRLVGNEVKTQKIIVR